MRSTASSSVNDLNNAFTGQTAGRSSLGPPSRPAIKRQNIPGHCNGPKKTKKEKTKHVQSIPKTVWLLDIPDDDVQITDDGCYGDYALNDDSVLVNPEIDLKSDQNEDDFVERERNLITTPIVKDNHTWDFGHAKHLCGNGRLYVSRLITDIDEISGKAGDKCNDDTVTATTSSISAPTPSQAYSNVDLCNTTSATTPEPGSETSASSAQPPCSVDDDDGDDDDELLRLAAAINSSLDQQKVDNLSMMFPRIPRDVIEMQW